MYIVLSALVAVVGVFSLIALQKRTAWLEHHKHCMDLFYEQTSKLVESDEVPDTILDVLAALSSSLNNASLAREILFDLVTGRVRRNVNDAARKDFADAFEKLRPELQGIFAQAAGSALLAITFRSFISGWILRRVTFFALRAEKRSRDSYLDEHRTMMTLEASRRAQDDCKFAAAGSF